MIHKILHAPINLYFDKTPVGVLLNRFSKDLNNIDFLLPYVVNLSIETSVYIIVTLLISGLSSYYVFIPIPFIVFAGGMLLRFFMKSYTEI